MFLQCLALDTLYLTSAHSAAQGDDIVVIVSCTRGFVLRRRPVTRFAACCAPDGRTLEAPKHTMSCGKKRLLKF
eukprot:277286-Amphidinium_carterae.2